MIPKNLTVDFANTYPYNALLDTCYYNSDEETPTIEEFLDIVEGFFPKEFENAIGGSLSQREREVFYQYYKEHKILNEIAKSYGVTKERIRQIKAKAIRKLRSRIRCYILPSTATPAAFIELTNELDRYKHLCEQYAMHLDKYLGIRKVKEELDNEDILGTPIISLNLSVRSYNCLNRAGIKTVGDLVGYSSGDLAKLRNLGRRSLTEIETILYDKYKLVLKGGNE